MVLAPASMGNPAVIASPAAWASHLISHGVPAWNTAFALVQLAIAVGLLWRPAVKAALAVSIAWSLAVWWFAEGLGGVLTGTATPGHRGAGRGRPLRADRRPRLAPALWL
jgi:hypothetical protein